LRSKMTPLMAQPSLFPDQQYLLGICRSSEERTACTVNYLPHFMLIPNHCFA
jgi:hypothetical protein